MATNNELELLKRDVFNSVMESEYQRKDSDFIRFMNSYTNGKGDDTVFDIVNTLYYKAVSQPFPLEYFEDIRKKSVSECDSFFDIPVINKYFDFAKNEFSSLAKTDIDGIYYSPFAGCTSLEKINLGGNIKELPAFLFAGSIDEVVEKYRGSKNE